MFGSSVFDLACSLPLSCFIPLFVHTAVSLIPSKRKKSSMVPSPCPVTMKSCPRRQSDAHRDLSYPPLPKCLMPAWLSVSCIEIAALFSFLFFSPQEFGWSSAFFLSFLPSLGLACLYFPHFESCESHFDLQPIPGETGDPNERAGCKGN